MVVCRVAFFPRIDQIGLTGFPKYMEMVLFDLILNPKNGMSISQERFFVSTVTILVTEESSITNGVSGWDGGVLP